MPRVAKAVDSGAIRPNTLIIDNGAWSIKAGLASGDCHVVPNCVARDQDRHIFVGAQLEKCKDFYHIIMRRPMERGMIVNWELERAIWHQTFLSQKEALVKCDPHETNLILAEAPHVFPALQSNCDQMVFEEFEFASYYRCVGSSLNAYHDVESVGDDIGGVGNGNVADYMTVVDSGFSHTTITPLINGRPVQSAIRRLDLGGKHVTNYLAELLAIHEISLKDDPWIANELKEQCCFVSDDFRTDMERTWRGHKMDPSIVVDCQLPDYQNQHKTIVTPYEAKDQLFKNKANILTMGNERFQAPEILFNPGDIGMTEGGLAEIIFQSITALPAGIQAAMFENILVVGGNAKIPGYLERLKAEVRQLAPDYCKVNVICPQDPIKSTWNGGVKLAANYEELKKHLVTRQEYLENGSNWLLRRFDGLVE